MNTNSITISPYNSQWPDDFTKISTAIKDVLADNLISIHHVGSTSVPGLAAKPTIDIIAEVHDGLKAMTPLESLSFEHKGEYNIPMRFGFAYRGEYNVPFRYYFNCNKINLHVFEKGNPEIEFSLAFRDYLRNHDDARDEYAKIKMDLASIHSKVKHQGAKLNSYTLGKDSFIRKVLLATGLKSNRLLRCAHYREWEQYHRIKNEQIFADLDVKYDPNHPTVTAENHFHFILCHGMDIVSIAHIEFLANDEAALRAIATDKHEQNKGYASEMLLLLEKWLKRHNKKILKLHSRLTAEKFYCKRGYDDMEFDDPCIKNEYVDLGKFLV